MTEPLLSGVPTAPEVPKTRVVDSGNLLRSGQIIANRYEVRQRLGHGGMGSVWRVYDRKLEEEVALKVILPDRMGDQTALGRFRDEVKIARKITDSNVCRVFDIGESEHLTFLTMELIEGTTLRKLLANGPIAPLRAVDMLQQIVKGVAAAHEHGIIHRDIKPENVLVRRDERCLVADFGLAHRPETNSMETAAGTPVYMSPEQLRGEPLDLRSDVFALGLVAFELLSGESPESARQAMTHGELPPLRRIPESMRTALQTIVKRALATDPRNRFDSAISFGIELARITQPIEDQSARDATFEPKAPTNTETTRPARPMIPRWLRWLIAAPFIFFGFLMLLVQLPRGDLRDWHPFSPNDDSAEEIDTKDRTTPEKQAPADTATLVVLPFENLTGDDAWNGLSRSAHGSIRDTLRTIPEITLVDRDVDTTLRVRGSVQRAGNGLLLVVLVEAVNVVDEALRGEPIEVAIDSKETTSLMTLRRQALDEAKLLLRHWRKRQKATLGTKNDEARAKLFQYIAMVGSAPRQQHVEAGMTLLNEALLLDSMYVPALVERAYLRIIGGPETFERRVAQSVVDLETASKVAPEDPDVALTICHVRQTATTTRARTTDEQIHEARAACQKALQLAPSSASVPIALARLSAQVCRDDEAVRLHEQSLDVDRGLRGRALEHLVEFTLLHGQLNAADRMSLELLSLQQEEEHTGARSFTRRAGAAPVNHAHWLRGVVLLRRGLADDAKLEFERELASMTAGTTERYQEAAALRGLMQANSLRRKTLAPHLEQRLAQLESQFRSELKIAPETALAVGDAYAHVDPEAAVEWLGRSAASSSCSDTIHRSFVYIKAGKRDLARQTLDICAPTQEWERSCMTEVRRRLGD